MSSRDWRWKIGEAVERIRTRYDYIGRKTGAPFLALVYPPEVEVALHKEWQTQTKALRPEFAVRMIDTLDVTQKVLSDIGAENVVASLDDPMPGSDPQSELGQLWVKSVAEAVQATLSKSGMGRPVASLQRLAALYPAAGPRDVMQRLWDSNQSTLDGPVVVLIPGHVVGPRTFSFVGKHDEFMYRGDLL